MKIGAKSTEFYALAAILAPWIATQFGINLPELAGNADTLIATLNQASGGSDMPAWAVIVYTLCRTYIKRQQV